MGWRSKPARIGIALGVIVALVVVAPALGGPSLRELIRQEVARQLDQADGPNALRKKGKARVGPRGPAGAQGAQGAGGAAGAAGAQGPGALKLDFDRPETDFGADVTLGTLNEMTVTADCGIIGGLATLQVFMTSNGLGGEVNFASTRDVNGAFPTVVFNGGTSLPADTQTFFFSISVPTTGDIERREIQATYRNANRVITLQLHAVSDDTAGRCKLQGAAIPAS